MDEILCAECGASLDVDCDWDFMDDDGDTIHCWSVIECDCGHETHVHGYYHWDGVYEID